jgi:hypothetical protein
MAYGTDAGIFPHDQNAKPSGIMVRYGMTPVEVIRNAALTAVEGDPPAHGAPPADDRQMTTRPVCIRVRGPKDGLP